MGIEASPLANSSLARARQEFLLLSGRRLRPRRLSRHLVRSAANRHGKRGNLVFDFSADITFFSRLASVDKQETRVN